MLEEIKKKIKEHSLRIAVIGMGYVGLPLAIEFSQHFEVIGFDCDKEKIEKYKQKQDPIGDFQEELKNHNIYFTSKEEDLNKIDVFIVTVPTPINEEKQPDLSNLIKAIETVEKRLNHKAMVIVESTVYPGVMEEVCLPLLEKGKWRLGIDFAMGYSPERINSADKKHTIKNTAKIVAGTDQETTDTMEMLYQSIIDAPIYKTPDIKTAEAAKVIENIQRDINIALVNELSIIFHNMGIDTKEVLQAAETKWNFMRYQPGLVGGHCIGVDPYYLAYQAKKTGTNPKLILQGREVNNYMAKYIVENLVKKLLKNNIEIKDAKIAILGITFKEECSDIRNTKVIDIIRELEEFQMVPRVYDPLANQEKVKQEYGIHLEEIEDIKDIDAIILAVPHQGILAKENLFEGMYHQKSKKKIILDIKRVLDKKQYLDHNYEYWGL